MAPDRELTELQLRKAIEGVDKGIAKDAVFVPSDDGFFVSITGELSGKSAFYAQRKRRELLRAVRAKATELGTPCTIHLTVDDAIERLEQLLSAQLRIESPSVASVSLTLPRRNIVAIHITTDIIFDESHKRLLHKTAKRLIHHHGLDLQDITFLGPAASIPSDAAILRSVRVIQPSSIQGLASDLEARGFKIKSRRWLQHQIDRLRQGGFVIASKNGPINLTGQAVANLPSFRGSRTADIERALAMGRRRW